MDKTIKIIVSGRVQGVGFRYHTRNQAKKLEVFGYVRNLDNGDVEIVAQGEKSKINKLINWCNSGSPSAVVKNVQVETLSESMIESNDFDIRY